MKRKWENLPTEVLRSVAILSGIVEWQSEFARLIKEDLPSTRLWKRIGRWVGENEKVYGVSVPLDVYWEEVPTHLDFNMVADIFISVYLVALKRVQRGESYSDEVVLKHHLSCVSCRASLIASLDGFVMTISGESKSEESFFGHFAAPLMQQCRKIQAEQMMKYLQESGILAAVESQIQDIMKTQDGAEANRKFEDLLKNHPEVAEQFSHWDLGDEADDKSK